MVFCYINSNLLSVPFQCIISLSWDLISYIHLVTCVFISFPIFFVLLLPFPSPDLSKFSSNTTYTYIFQSFKLFSQNKSLSFHSILLVRRYLLGLFHFPLTLNLLLSFCLFFGDLPLQYYTFPLFLLWLLFPLIHLRFY